MNKVTKRFTPVVSDAEIAEAVQRYKTMPAEQVRAELAALNINPQPTIDAVKEIVAAASAKLHDYRRSHHEPPQVVMPAATRAARVLHANRRRSLQATAPVLQPTALWRGFFSSADPGIVLPWSATRCVGDRLHRAAGHGAAAGSEAVLHEAFEHLGAVVGELRTRCAADLDAAWPLGECLVETGIEVSTRPPLWRLFASGFADLHSASSPAVQGMLVHALYQLFAAGPDTAGVAVLAAVEILHRTPSAETHMLIIRLAQRHDVLHHAAAELLGPVDAETRDTASAIDAAKHDALENFPKLRVRRAEGGFFDTRPVATLIEQLHAGPLASFLAMYALGEVYLCAATLIAQDPKPRQKEQHAVFADRVRHQLADPTGLCFLTVGSLEFVRDKYPHFAALTTASLLEGLPVRARTALFVCIAEGYERSYRGQEQETVPRYELDGPVRFVAGDPHALDVFGERVTASPAAEELRPHMEWFNARLRRWAMRDHRLAV